MASSALLILVLVSINASALGARVVDDLPDSLDSDTAASNRTPGFPHFESAAVAYRRAKQHKYRSGFYNMSLLEAGDFIEWPGQSYKIWDSAACSGVESAFCVAVAALNENIVGCKDTSPWKNVMARHVEQVEEKVAEEIRLRLENPVAHIDQADNGFCGIAWHVFVMAVAMPTKYVEMMLSIFCTGKYKEFDSSNSYVEALDSLKALIKMAASKHKAITNFDLAEKEISSVDWMAMATMRDSLGDHKTFQTSVEEDAHGMRQAQDDKLTAMLWGIQLAPMLNWRDQPNPLPAEIWDPVVAAAENELTFVVLHVHVIVSEEEKQEWMSLQRRGGSNHELLLVHTIMWKGNKFCVLWTWADLFQVKCEQLAKYTVRAYKLDLDELVTEDYIEPDMLDLNRIKDLKQLITKAGFLKFRAYEDQCGKEFKK